MKALTEKRILSDAELSQLIATCLRHRGERDSLLIRLALYTGARACEVLQVRPRDISATGVTIYGAKGSNDRTIPIGGPAHPDQHFLRELQGYITQHGITDSSRIFPMTTRHFRRIWDTWRPEPPKDLLQAEAAAFRGLAVQAPKPVQQDALGRAMADRTRGAHMMRHSFGVRLYRNCRDILQTKSSLGHKNIANTLVYSEYDNSLERPEAMKGMFTKPLTRKVG